MRRESKLTIAPDYSGEVAIAVFCLERGKEGYTLDGVLHEDNGSRIVTVEKEVQTEGFDKDTFADCTGTSRKVVDSFKYKTYLHTGNHKLYFIDGVAYNGESDQWGLCMKEVTKSGSVVAGAPVVFRTLSNFLGDRFNSNSKRHERRFLEVK